MHHAGQPQPGTRVGQIKCSTALCTSANDFESAASMDLGVANKFERVGDFANMESVNHEARLIFTAGCWHQDNLEGSKKPVRVVLGVG